VKSSGQRTTLPPASDWRTWKVPCRICNALRPQSRISISLSRF